jgi:hypothetical protein
MAKRPPWVDYLMVDSHGDFPEYVRQQGVPGGYPVVNFPEISMTGMYPWGGFGANPLPGRFQRLWDQCRNTVAGGFPYSEGIFEDLNKTCCLQFYWDPARPAAEIVQEYAAYEFGPAAVVQVQRAVEILEANHNHHAPEPQGGAVGRRYNLAAAKRDTAARARQLLRDTESLLPAWAARGWRWRILRIRAELDAHLTANGGLADAQTDTWLAELCRIYHADHAEYAVRPPVGS